MADIPARTEIGVTTGPIRGSRKIHVGPLGVKMREIDLEPSSRRAPAQRLRHLRPLYRPGRPASTSRPACPTLRRDWIWRAATSRAPTPAKSAPRITASSAPTARGGVPQFPNVVKRPLRAKAGA